MFKDYSQELANDFLGYDPSYSVLYHHSWEGWEEAGWVWIFERDGEYYYHKGWNDCFSPYLYERRPFLQAITKCSIEESLEIIDEWEKL